MIVCVLLVSNSRGCCLAAPGDHEGAVIARRGETTPWGVWHQQYTHNHVWSLNFSMFKVRQFNPCKQFVFFKYHLIKTFWLIFICFPRIIMVILLPILWSAWLKLSDKPCGDITEVALMCRKGEQSGHLTPWDNGKMCTYNQVLNRAVRGLLDLFICWYYFHNDRK